MVGNFRCSPRPAGSERPGLKLGRHQPLFHFPSLGCYVTCLWGILLDPCLEAVRLGFHLSRFVRVADDHKSVPNRLLSVHQFRLVEAASEVFAAVVLDELYRLRQSRLVRGLVSDVVLVNFKDCRSGIGVSVERRPTGPEYKTGCGNRGRY